MLHSREAAPLLINAVPWLDRGTDIERLEVKLMDRLMRIVKDERLAA